MIQFLNVSASAAGKEISQMRQMRLERMLREPVILSCTKLIWSPLRR